MSAKEFFCKKIWENSFSRKCSRKYVSDRSNARGSLKKFAVFFSREGIRENMCQRDRNNAQGSLKKFAVFAKTAGNQQESGDFS
jgi:hypothetical protein